jgi:hypothetical protein
MDLGSEGVSVYAEAKSEYNQQLCQYLIPSVQQYFLDLLEEAKQKEADPKRVLLMFQTLLEDISEWNVDKVERETTAVIKSSQCDYLEELMTAVFIAHTKVLSAIRLTTRQKKLQITIPKLQHFIHRILRECSRLLWSNTYLFSTTAPSIERQKNLRQIENFLHEGVLQGIRGMLPVKNILREYLKEDEEVDEQEEQVDAAEEKSVKEEEVEEKKKEGKETKKGAETHLEEDEEEKNDGELVSEKLEEIQVPAPTTPIPFTGNDTLDEEDIFVDVGTGLYEGQTDTDDDNDKVEILDTPPEPMDGFEDVDKKEELVMDFETLE